MSDKGTTMASLYDLLQRMFIYYGFDLRGNLEEGYAVAHKGSLKVIIAVKKRYVDADDTRFFADVIKQEGAEKGIFVALTNYSDEAQRVAEKGKVLMWDRERFESELGKVILAEAEGLKRDTGEELFEQVLGLFDPQKSTVEVGTKRIGKDGKEEIEIKVPSEEPAHPGIKRTLVEDEMILTPVVGLEAAAKLAQSKIKHAFKYDLQLIPYYLFDFECEVVLEKDDGKGKTKPYKANGTVGVNALTHEVERWTRKSQFTRNIDTAHTKLEPKVGEDDAKKAATEFVIELNTRVIQERSEKRHVTVFEKKKVRPKADAVKLERIALVYLPVWGVVGTNGVVVIDATSGEVVREDQ
jgi:hypothetical protein